MTRPRRFVVLARLGLMMFSIVVGVLLVEGMVRIFLPDWAPRTTRLAKFWRYDARYGWAHRPGANGMFQTFDFEVPVSINAKGFRGPDVPYTRDGRRPRILFLGDSLTWGFGVRYEDIFVTRLEGMLPGIETVNLAVSGYSTDQELLLYRDEGRKYQPDLVVVVVAYNDNDGNHKTVEYFIYGKPAFVVRDARLELVNQPVVRTSWARRAAIQVAWHSYLLTGLQRLYYESGVGETRAQMRARHDAAMRRGLEDSASLGLPPRAAPWALTVRLLLEMAAATRADGANLVVVLANNIPAAREISGTLAASDVEAIVLDDVFDTRARSHFPSRYHSLEPPGP